MFEALMLNFVKKYLNVYVAGIYLIVTHYLPEIFFKNAPPLKIIVALP
jgi:hypothetical protein